MNDLTMWNPLFQMIWCQNITSMENLVIEYYVLVKEDIIRGLYFSISILQLAPLPFCVTVKCLEDNYTWSLVPKQKEMKVIGTNGFIGRLRGTLMAP